jgi:hypothetical protein
MSSTSSSLFFFSASVLATGALFYFSLVLVSTCFETLSATLLLCFLTGVDGFFSTGAALDVDDLLTGSLAAAYSFFLASLASFAA